MTLKTEATYPSRRAYVLKVRGDAEPGALAGRLENLVTGEQREFSTGGELLESIASDLDAKSGQQRLDSTTRHRGSDE
ncbi:MAG: hypothetical protein U1F15_10560 [Burkholderiales bacterium]